MALTFIMIHRDFFKASSIKILDYLNIIFGDRHKTQRAVETLHIMKQNSKKFFFGFILRFKKALIDAEGMN